MMNFFRLAAIAYMWPTTMLTQAKPPQARVVWKDPEFVASALAKASLARHCSDNKDPTRCADQASLLLDSLRLNLQGENGGLAASKSFTVRFPIEILQGPAKPRAFHTLRFFISKPRDASVQLLVSIDGELTVINYPRGKAVEGEIHRELRRRINRTASTHLMTIALVAERATNKDPVLVAVESDDIVIR